MVHWACIHYRQDTSNQQYQEENQHWDELSPQLDELNQQFLN